MAHYGRHEGGDREQGYQDRRDEGSRPAHGSSSLLRPSYLSGGQDYPAQGQRQALLAPATMRVMGGAGITDNLDRPNMPVRHHVEERLVERSRPSKRGGEREDREDRRKKRRSRWTDEACKTFIPGGSGGGEELRIKLDDSNIEDKLSPPISATNEVLIEDSSPHDDQSPHEFFGPTSFLRESCAMNS